MMHFELSISQQSSRQTMTCAIFCLGNGQKDKVEKITSDRRRGKREERGREDGMGGRRGGEKRSEGGEERR